MALDSKAVDSREVARQFVEAFNSGDPERVLNILTEDATWKVWGDLPVSGEYHGRDAVLNDFFGRAMTYFGELSFELTNTVAEGDQAVIEWTVRGHAANGNEYNNYYALVLKVRDGKVAGVREYTDTQYAYDVVFKT